MDPGTSLAVITKQLVSPFDRDIQYTPCLESSITYVQGFRDLDALAALEVYTEVGYAFEAVYNSSTRSELNVPCIQCTSDAMCKCVLEQDGSVPLRLIPTGMMKKKDKPLFQKLFTDNKADVMVINETKGPDASSIIRILTILSEHVPLDLENRRVSIKKEGTTINIRLSANYNIPSAMFKEIAEDCKQSGDTELKGIWLQPNHVFISIIAQSNVRTSAYVMRRKKKRRTVTPYDRLN